MSRLMASLEKMKQSNQVEMSQQQSQDIQKFKIFYDTEYYGEYKQNILDKIADMDRLSESNPQALVLLQGRRQAYREMLDILELKERRVGEQIISKRTAE